MSAFLRVSITAIVLASIALFGVWRLTLDEKQKQILALEAQNADLQARVAARQAMIDRLCRSRRIAHLHIRDQELDASGRVVATTLDFIELDDEGSELARQTFTVPGDVLFVDAWTAKFDAEAVAQGDPLMGRTLVLLRRIYSDRQPPQEGQPIDTPGAVPPAYAAAETGRFEQRIWSNFWKLATDPAAARQAGVRVAQGEAVYKPVRKGQTYELIVDAAGGMSLTPLDPQGDSALTHASESVPATGD